MLTGRRVAVLLAAACLLSVTACNGSAAPTSPMPSPVPAPDPQPDPPPPADPAPRDPTTVFGAGEHLVGDEIPAGTYYSDPEPGCYWERQSGAGAAAGDTAAFAFIGFDAAQWIVEVLPADRAFETNAPCGTWVDVARLGAQASIRPGVWEVGEQIRPGMYRTTASAGCYWERLRHFTGARDGVIAGEFTSAGAQFVTIAATDAGFRSDGACGTWERVE